jgi:type I restriction enzyme S subunit
MTEWKIYRLGDIASFSQGIQVDIDKQLPYKKGGYVRFIRIVDFTKANEPYRYIETPKKQYLTNSGDIVMIRYGSQTAGLVVKSFEGAIANNMFKITLDEQVVDRDFIYYALSQEDIFSSLRNAQSSSTMPAITFEIASRIQLKIPSLEEQRRIAGILGAIDDKIENNRRINDNLEQQAQALFEEWISKSKTSKGVFDDIIQTTLAGDWGQETTQGNYTHEVFCIRGADIPALQNGDKGKMPIRYILEKNYKTKQLRANDLVIEISGGSPTQSTGRICMITQSLLDRLGKDVVCTNFCRAITPKNGYAIYIYLYWQMLYNKNTMFSYENGTTGIKNLNIADLISKEPIEIPAQEDVEKLNIVLQPIFDQIYANGLQNETLATLRDTLLPKLMNGEIKL